MAAITQPRGHAPYTGRRYGSFSGRGPSPVTFTGTVSDQTGTVGSAFSWTGTALASYYTGTYVPFTYTVQSGTLPTGLTLNSSTGVVTGTPTLAGNATIVFRATDTASNTASSNSVQFTIAASGGGGTYTAVIPGHATDYTGTSTATSIAVRVVAEPFTTVQALGTGTREAFNVTTHATTGDITLSGLANPGAYFCIIYAPQTGGALTAVAGALVTAS